MNAIDNSKIQTNDISLGDLVAILSGAKDSPLVFYYDGHAVKPGYHVTEVKAGHFSALDCGANPEAWSEIFIQLWDIDECDRTHMSAGKFHSIIRKVTEHVQLDGSAKLTFEVSDGVRPMQLYCASLPTLRAGVVNIELLPRPASCKPRDRWLAKTSKESAACCRPQAAEQVDAAIRTDIKPARIRSDGKSVAGALATSASATLQLDRIGKMEECPSGLRNRS